MIEKKAAKSVLTELLQSTMVYTIHSIFFIAWIERFSA